jgi:hypothetical protein
MMTTAYFLAEGVVVPRIHHLDLLGRFAVKDRIEGESLTSLYIRLAQLTARAQELILGDLERYLNRLLGLLTPGEVFILLKAARTVEFDAEQTILRQGEVGENFYLVLDGVVEARRSTLARAGSWNVSVGNGSAVGEMAFLLHVTAR